MGFLYFLSSSFISNLFVETINFIKGNYGYNTYFIRAIKSRRREN